MIWIITQLILGILDGFYIKTALNTGIEPLNFSAQVFFFTCLFVGIYGLITKQINFKSVEKKDYFTLFMVGFLIGGFLNIAGFLALKHANLTNVTFLGQAGVIFSVIIGMLFLKEKRVFREYLFLGILFIGLFLFATTGKLVKLSYGDTLILISALLGAVSGAMSQLLVKKLNPITFSFIRSGLIGVFLLIFTACIGKLDFSINYLWVSGCSLIVAFLIISTNKALVYIRSSQMSILNLLVPIITAFLSFFIFGDILKPIQIFGAILIILGVYFLELYKFKFALSKLKNLIINSINSILKIKD